MSRNVINLMIAVCLLGFGFTAQAQLFDPPIDNPSFEATDLGAGGTGQWVDYVEQWTISSQGACYLEDGSWDIVAPDGVATLKMWNGAGLWQQIGSWRPNTDYEIALWIGRGLETGDILVELWAGGSPDLVPNSGFGTIDGTVGATLIVGDPLVPTVPLRENEWMSLVLNTGTDFELGDALWLRIESTGEAAWVDNITVVALADPALAHHPNPVSGSADVLREGLVGWTPGMFAQRHDVYLGTDLDSVINASRTDPLGVLVSEDQDASNYEFGDLEFGRTYFWRIDEVNGAPDRTVFKGDIWDFTVEPFAYPLQTVTATASSSGGNDLGPEKTIDGSGLNEQDQHARSATDMWLSETEANPWIQYEFDKAYTLHEMWVWNSNQSIESFVGFGAKDVTVETSVDGIDWTPLAGPIQFNQGTGQEEYTANTVVEFSQALAKFVRITVHAGWGEMSQTGLSEVRFFYVPMRAREPKPQIGATDVAVNTILGWSPGRAVVEHSLHLSTDQQAVIDGSVPVTTTSQSRYSPTLAFSSTYFWRVDEVNNAEVVTTWPGDVWNFTTQDYLVVDDFESYNDLPEDQESSHRVYVIWEDGYADPATNGSTIGYLTDTFLETDNVHGGDKSVPLFYDNTAASLSEVTCNTNNLPIGSNWSIGSPQALVLWLRGDPDNNSATDQLYVKIGNAKVMYEGDISIPQWRQWSIDLAVLGVNLNNVLKLTIGLEGSGGKGVVLLDDIRLYGISPVVSLQPDAQDNLTVNPSFESPDLGAGGTGQWADVVDDWIINAQGNCYLEDGSWDIVAPDGVATLKMWNGAALWQQIGNVIPNTDYEISLFIGRGYDASAVQVELWAGGDPSALPASYGIIGETVGATLIDGASLTPTIAVGQSELMSLSLNTGTDFNAQDALWVRIVSIGGDGTGTWIDNVMVVKP
jgi:hypothetical protein